MSASARYELGVARTEEEFHALREEWQQLYEASSPRNPCLSYEWAAACSVNISLSSRPFIVTARCEGRLIGLAPLRIESQRRFRVLQMTGKIFGVYTPLLTSPDFPDAEAALLEALGRFGRQWDLLRLDNVADDYSSLNRVALPKSLRGRRLARDGAPYLALDADWETLCRVGPSWLKNVQKRVRRFAREGGVVERYTGSEAAAHVEVMADIEARSWKSRHGRLTFQYERVRRLIADILAALGPRQEMELWIARLNGKPVGYELNLLTPDRLWLYEGAYDEGYAKLGVGAVLEFQSIYHSWNAGRREYDYGVGEEDYKSERTNAVRPVQQLFLYPATPRGRLAYLLLAAPRCIVQESPVVRATVQLLNAARTHPRALLPGSGVVWSRLQH